MLRFAFIQSSIRTNVGSAVVLHHVSLPQVGLRLPPGPTEELSPPAEYTGTVVAPSFPKLPPLPPFPSSIPLIPPPEDTFALPPVFSGSVVETQSPSTLSIGTPPPLPPAPTGTSIDLAAVETLQPFTPLQHLPPPPPIPPPDPAASTILSLRGHETRPKASDGFIPREPLSAAQALLSLQKSTSIKIGSSTSSQTNGPPQKRARIGRGGESAVVDAKSTPFTDARIDGSEARGLASVMSECVFEFYLLDFVV